MGFAALGNAAKPAGFWRRRWLPEWTSEVNIGTELDDTMSALFSYCQSADVPIMAHANVSNGPADDFQELAGPAGWALALAKHPKLRISFGHFGGAPTAADSLGRARAFAALMHEAGDEPGAFAFADAGFFVEVVGRSPTPLLEALRQLYEETVTRGDAALANRFMYGTDWLMTLSNGGVDRYLDRFVDLFGKLEQQPAFRRARLQSLTEKFLGLNAARWLGLRRGEGTRDRLERFYAAHGVPTPDWAQKVDRELR
jgi:predicted TIM-barrel fold metal-dependent hydrolase